MGPQGERVEFQIRTEDMHKTAEQGIAAHWRYKEGGKSDEKVTEKFAWLRQLLDWQQDTAGDAHDFMETLKIVKTSRARAKIRAWIKAAEKERSITLGKELLEREIQKYGLNASSLVKSEEMSEVARRFSLNTPIDLMAEIGFGKISVIQVLTRLLPKEVLEARQKPTKADPKQLPLPEVGGVKVSGVEDIMTRYARCCNPVPGDDIVGFITIGRGVSIHTSDCPRLVEFTPERMIEVEWDVEEVIPHPVGISVVTVDRTGMLAKISAAIALADVNIREATVTTSDEQRALFNFVIDINDLNHLQGVMKTIRQVKGVISVTRVKDWPRKRHP
jgi:GTP pyrophosphokinase